MPAPVAACQLVHLWRVSSDRPRKRPSHRNPLSNPSDWPPPCRRAGCLPERSEVSTIHKGDLPDELLRSWPEFADVDDVEPTNNAV
jgi:hypothetical protein